MIYTPQQAAEYIVRSIKETSGEDIDTDIIEGIIEDQMHLALEEKLSQEDLALLEQHDDAFFWDYCQEKVADYYKTLDTLIEDLLMEYFAPEEDEQEAGDSNIAIPKVQ